MNKYRASLLVAVLILCGALLAQPVWAQGRAVFGWVVADRATIQGGGLTVMGNIDGVDAALSGDLTVGDDATFAGTLTYTPSTTQTVTMNDSITADSAVVLLTSAGTVNTSNVACGPNGATVTYINVGAQSIVLTDTGTLKLSGNTTLAALDTLTLQSVWGNCIELAQADN